MGDQHGGGAGLDEQGPQVDREAVVQRPVETGERLVEEDDDRIGDHRSRQGHPFGLTSRQCRHLPRGEAVEADTFEPFGGATVTGPSVDTLHLQPEGHVVDHRSVREQLVVLEHEPDVPPMRRDPGHVGPADPNRTRLRRDDPRDHLQQGALAAARRSEQRDDLARRHRQRCSVEHDPVAEPHRDTVDVERGAHHTVVRARSTGAMRVGAGWMRRG